MQNRDVAVRILTKKGDTARRFQEILRATEGFEIQEGNDSRRPDLIIFELGPDTEKDFKQVSSLLNEGAVEEIFLTQEDPRPEVLLQAIRVGTKEFLSQPLVEEDVRDALLRYRERRVPAAKEEKLKQGTVINVIGSKGGVGSTTVAVNLAVSLAEMEGVESVALIDMNMLFGEIPLFLDIKPKYHWGEIAKQINRLDRDLLMNILSRHPSGVYVLSSPSHLYHDQEKITKIMDQLLGLMKRNFDFIIVDGGHTLDQASSKVLELSDQVLLLSILSLPCLTNTNKLLESFHILGYPPRERIKVVVNRYAQNADIPLADAETSLHMKIFWTLPNQYQATMTAINNGKPLQKIAPKATITKSIQKMAYALAGREDVEEKKKPWSFLGRRRSEPEDSEGSSET